MRLLLVFALLIGLVRMNPTRIEDTDETEYEFLVDSLKKCGQWYKQKEVVVTRYRPLPEETDDTPLQTADLSIISLEKLKKGEIRWVAVSRDLLRDYSYGGTIRLTTGDPEIDGEYEIHDTMNPRWTGRIDILTHPSKSLGKGRWTGLIEEI